MKTFRVKVEGVDRLKKKLGRLEDDAIKVVGKALLLEANRIYIRSQELVPRGTSNLAQSGHVTAPEFTRNTATVKVGYGGNAAPYALAVHENPRSGKTGGRSPSGRKYYYLWARVGQWKYLEIPFKEAQRGMRDRFAETINRELLKRAGRT